MYCPHQERGCDWKGELGELPKHLNQNPKSDKLLKGCQFQEIQCELCQSHSCEHRLMTDHVSTQYPNRDVECEYHFAGCKVKKPQEQLESHRRKAVNCHLSLVANLLQGSLSEKDKEIEELKEELRQQRKQIQGLKQHQHWMVLLLLVTIIGAILIHAFLYNDSSVDSEPSSKIKNLTFHRQLLKEQFTNSCMNMSNLTTGFHSKLQELETGIGQINSNVQQLEMNQDSVVKLWQEISSLVKMKGKTREQVLDKLLALFDLTEKNAEDLKSSKIISINESLECVKEQLVTIESEIHYLGQQVDFPVLPVYLNMTNVEEYSVSKSGWLSEPFYTHEGGYRMRLVVYPNGKHSGAGTHVSVAVYLMSGKYDHKLDWPLNMTLSVTLLNQDSEDKDPISRLIAPLQLMVFNTLVGSGIVQ